MSASSPHRKLRAARGFLKVAGMLLAMPFWLIVWAVRAAAARRRFLRELQAAGVPEDAAYALSRRYKLHLRDFGKVAAKAGQQFSPPSQAVQ